MKQTQLISQPLACIFHGKHLAGAVLPGVGGRGRRPFQSADPGGVPACGSVLKEKVVRKYSSQKRFATSIRPGAEGVKGHSVHPGGATFADRHGVLSHVGSGELPDVPGSSREVSGGALGSPEGSFLGPV